jgi:hypothetical protein
MELRALSYASTSVLAEGIATDKPRDRGVQLTLQKKEACMERTLQ